MYNLINESKDPYRSASVLDAQTEKFARVLTKWQNLENVPPYLAFFLDHQYTDRDLRLARLKGNDYHHVRHVAQSCTVHGEFYTLLANISMQITDLNGEDTTKESKLILSRIVDLEGADLSVYHSLTISDSFLMKKKSYSDREPDIQRGGNYMGNQHAEIDQFFNDSVSASYDWFKK